MNWTVTRTRKWEDPGEEVDVMAVTDSDPIEWMREHVPGALFFNSPHRVGMTISFTLTYEGGDTTTYTLTREER